MKKYVFLLALALFLFPQPPRAETLGEAVESFGDSIGQGLENLGEQLNRANSSFLNSVDGNNAKPQGYEAQMRAYRQLENARVKEMATVTGVSQDYIRQLREDGATWEQIANQYGVNLDSLPAPQVTPQN